MVTKMHPKELIIAMSTLISSVRYVILSKRVSCSVSAALERTSIVR